MLNSYSNVEDAYVDLKLRLIKLAVDGSKNLTTFALLEEVIELQAQFCYSEAELQQYSNDILLLKCQLLYKKLMEHVSDLVDYGITDRKLQYIKQTMDDFQSVALHYNTSDQEHISNSQIVTSPVAGS